jgi:hypothetical protein
VRGVAFCARQEAASNQCDADLQLDNEIEIRLEAGAGLEESDGDSGC